MNNGVEHSMKMSWQERILISVNIEYLWRCMLISQDRILSKHLFILDKSLSTQKDEFDEKKAVYQEVIHKMQKEIDALHESKKLMANDYESK